MAKFQKGDKVKFVNAVGGGVVVRIEGNKIFVQDDTGFDIPMSPQELIRMADQVGVAQVFNQEVSAPKTEPVQKTISIDEAVRRANNSCDDLSLMEMEDEIKRLRSQNASLKDRIHRLEAQIINLQRTLAKVVQ